jgi:hypothetical protein
MTANTASRQQLEAIGEDLPILGFNVSWRVSKVLIPLSDLQALLDKHNFADQVDAIRDGAAVSRSLTEMANEGYLQEVQDGTADTALKRKRDSDNYAVYVLIAEKADHDRAAHDVTFRHRTALKVRLNKHPKPGEDALSFSSPEAEAVLRPMIDKYKHAYNSRDFTRLLTAIVKRHAGYSIIDQGGMYHVPTPNRAAGEDLVKRLRALVDDVATVTGRECYLSAFRQINDKDARKDMSRHAHIAMVASLKQERKYLREMSDDERTCRRDTIMGHIQAVEDLANNAGSVSRHPGDARP